MESLAKMAAAAATATAAVAVMATLWVVVVVIVQSEKAQEDEDTRDFVTLWRRRRRLEAGAFCVQKDSFHKASYSTR